MCSKSKQILKKNLYWSNIVQMETSGRTLGQYWKMKEKASNLLKSNKVVCRTAPTSIAVKKRSHNCCKINQYYFMQMFILFSLFRVRSGAGTLIVKKKLFWTTTTISIRTILTYLQRHIFIYLHNSKNQLLPAWKL